VELEVGSAVWRERGVPAEQMEPVNKAHIWAKTTASTTFTADVSSFSEELSS